MRHSGALSARFSRSARLLLTLTMLAIFLPTALGADTTPARKPSFRDVMLTKKVRDALGADKQLSLLKLFVAVKDRVAILEGEVGTQEQLNAAAKRVEKVPGIAEVRTILVKVVAPKNDDTLTIPLLPDPPSRAEALYPNRPIGAIGLPTALPHFAEPVPEIVSVRLEPPIALPVEPVTTLRATTPASDDAVAAVIERARQGNARFRLLKVEVRGELVWLRGSADQLDTGMKFAQELTDRGVRHVVVQCNGPGGR